MCFKGEEARGQKHTWDLQGWKPHAQLTDCVNQLSAAITISRNNQLRKREVLLWLLVLGTLLHSPLLWAWDHIAHHGGPTQWREMSYLMVRKWERQKRWRTHSSLLRFDSIFPKTLLVAPPLLQAPYWVPNTEFHVTDQPLLWDQVQTDAFMVCGQVICYRNASKHFYIYI